MKRTLLAIALLVFPVTAAAQSPPRSGPGPLVVERLENRFVVAPDFKITEIDGDTGQLAGGYAGWLAEDTLLVGGAVYWLANGPDDAEMTYGGLLIGWSTPAERRIQFGARGLVGVGRASLGTDVTQFARFGSRRGGGPATPPATTTVRVQGRDDFFVFEPQLTVVTKLTDHLGITWGAGYRLTGYTEFADDRLRGVTGSVALQLAGW
jgi:hypothetical protein